MTVSMVNCATDTDTRNVDAIALLETIRDGGRNLRGAIEAIRKSNDADRECLKKKLPAVTWSGTFSRRESGALVRHSGLLCADLDGLNDDLDGAAAKLKTSPHLWAVFISPSGTGLKAVFRMPADATKHAGSFRAVERHVFELTGMQIDASGKDVTRLCFLSHDPELYHNPNATEIAPLPEPEKPKQTTTGVVNVSERQQIAMDLLGCIDWQSEAHGFLTCPGKHMHTTGDNVRDCEINIDGAPTVFCFHNSCRGIIDAINRELRSRIGKAEHQPVNILTEPEPVELSPPPKLYVPPPLELLPAVLQDYIHAAAESINVDVAFILLPIFSSLATAIGNSRAIRLKAGFIQPPVIWSGIIARSGGRKSPSEDEGCFATWTHERELMRQNQEAAELYNEELAQWERQKGKRGTKPEKPPFRTCTCDDLTIEVLADILATNPRGILVRKDELSHWLASFDQYKSAHGSDVSRWLSLHTAVALAVDRRTDARHYRIANPRVSITGGIQPKILRRALTAEFFERGLPARFIFAFPPFRQDKWSETTVSDDLRAQVLDLFSELWLLRPNDGNPQLLGLDRDAKAVFIDFYNKCGECALEASEQEEAAWSKLTGYSARFALIGQLTHKPDAEVVTSAVMEAACNLARWSGNESVRIYAELAETREQRDRRELLEFIQRRGGNVTVRDVMTNYWPLKNQREEVESRLSALHKSGFGKWEETSPSGRGRPTRVFRLLPTSASAQFPNSRGETPNYADADVRSRAKNPTKGILNL